MIGRSLTDKIRNKLDYQPSEIFTRPQNPTESSAGFTQAQKIVGKACGLDGVRPGMTCEPNYDHSWKSRYYWAND